MMNNDNCKNNYISTVKMDNELMFKKVTDPEIGQFVAIDLSAGRNLRRLSYLLKCVEDLATSTFIHSPAKEFLANIVNTRHSIILQKMRENIETLRLICTIDRNYRAKRIKRLKKHSMSIRGSCDSQNLDLYKEHCMEIEGGEEMADVVLTSEQAATLITQGCDFNEIDINLCNINLSNMTDLENIISKTADCLSAEVDSSAKAHSSNFNTLGGTNENENNKKDNLVSLLFELDMIEGTETPVIKDVRLDQAAYKITSPINLLNKKGFDTVIRSTSSKYTKVGFIDDPYLLDALTEPVVDQQWYVLKPNSNYGL
jgi:hypothetical protein